MDVITLESSDDSLSRLAGENTGMWREGNGASGGNGMAAGPGFRLGAQ